MALGEFFLMWLENLGMIATVLVTIAGVSWVAVKLIDKLRDRTIKPT